MCWMMEIPHDKSIITLLETAKANITFNCDMFVFKSKVLKVFSGNPTPKGYKADPKKVQAITEMRPPQNLQHLESCLGLVNCINHFSQKLSELTVPLRALSKRDAVYTWKAQKKQHFRQSIGRSPMHPS